MTVSEPSIRTVPADMDGCVVREDEEDKKNSRDKKKEEEEDEDDDDADLPKAFVKSTEPYGAAAAHSSVAAGQRRCGDSGGAASGWQNRYGTKCLRRLN